jgi:hypothetical protein
MIGGAHERSSSQMIYNPGDCCGLACGQIMKGAVTGCRRPVLDCRIVVGGWIWHARPLARGGGREHVVSTIGAVALVASRVRSKGIRFMRGCHESAILLHTSARVTAPSPCGADAQEGQNYGRQSDDCPRYLGLNLVKIETDAGSRHRGSLLGFRRKDSFSASSRIC